MEKIKLENLTLTRFKLLQKTLSLIGEIHYFQTGYILNRKQQRKKFYFWLKLFGFEILKMRKKDYIALNLFLKNRLRSRMNRTLFPSYLSQWDGF